MESLRNASFIQWNFNKSLTVLRKMIENLSDWVKNTTQDIRA